MKDWSGKKIFIKNFNGELTSGDLIRELELVTSAIKRDCGEDMKYPSTNKPQIQRLKQVVWILEENTTKYGVRYNE